MTFNQLIAQLEVAAKKSLHFADQEREKALHGAYFPFVTRHPRSLTRENFFRERHCAIVTIIEKLKILQQEEDEEREEIIYLARRVIAEMTHVWIRRKSLTEELYNEVYKDTWFEPYAKDLPHQKEFILRSGIDVLGLEIELERELHEALLHKFPEEDRKKHAPLVKDVVAHVPELHNMFKDDWTKKANLIRFRLYEVGVLV